MPHQQVKAPAGRQPLASIKVMPDDPEAMLTQADEIKKRYAQIFKV